MGLHNCTHAEDVALRCTGTAPQEGTDQSTGPLTATFKDAPQHHDVSSAFTLRLAFSADVEITPADMLAHALTVGKATLTAAARVDGRKDLWELTLEPVGTDAVSIQVPLGRACAETGALCTADGRTLSVASALSIPGPPSLTASFQGMPAEHGGSEFWMRIAFSDPIRTQFRVLRDQALSATGSAVTRARRVGGNEALWEILVQPSGTGPVTVSLAWSGSCEGFNAGQTAKTVSVTVLDDSHDEGNETLTLTLSNPSGSYIADGTAVGTISNNDPMPQAWLARFGRTVAEQVLEAVEDRLRAAPRPGIEMTLAGERVGGGVGPEDEETRKAAEAEAHARLKDLSQWLAGETEAQDRRSGWRPVASRDLLTRSSFALTAEADGAGGGMASLWGRGALSRFDGRSGDLTVSGEVTGLMLGADWTRDPGSGSGAGSWTAGLLLSHARGEGSYRGADRGTVSSTVTGLYPYGRYALNDRVTVWGTVGYGAGSLTLTPDDRQAIETGMDLTMAAAGLRGVAVQAPPEGGPELAVKTDAMAARTSSEAVRGGTGGNLAAAAEVTRLRLGVEGTWRGLEIGTGVLEPRLEVGVRHDGGDAETGFGLDLGGGLAWSDEKTGIRAEVSGRGLLTHEGAGFRQRGIAGSLGWDPTPGSDRGPSLTLRQTMGLSAAGGVDALLGRRTLAGLAANDNGDELERRRLELTLGYGFPALGDRFTSGPEIGFGLSDAAREYRLGWRLKRDMRGDPGSLELLIEGRRRESANPGSGAGAAPEQSLGIRLTARF